MAQGEELGTTMNDSNNKQLKRSKDKRHEAHQTKAGAGTQAHRAHIAKNYTQHTRYEVVECETMNGQKVKSKLETPHWNNISTATSSPNWQ